MVLMCMILHQSCESYFIKVIYYILLFTFVESNSLQLHVTTNINNLIIASYYILSYFLPSLTIPVSLTRCGLDLRITYLIVTREFQSTTISHIPYLWSLESHRVVFWVLCCF